MSLNYINPSETFDDSRRGARIRIAGLVQSKYSRRRSRWHRHWMQKDGWSEGGRGGGRKRLARGKAGGTVKAPPGRPTDTPRRHSTSTLDQPTNQPPRHTPPPCPFTLPPPFSPSYYYLRCSSAAMPARRRRRSLSINENDVTAKSPAFNYQRYASHRDECARARARARACVQYDSNIF